MIGKLKIKTALISVYSKENIEELGAMLVNLNIQIFSTGGTFEFLKSKGIPAISIESITSYPSILGGRVKTLHPKIFGGILWRRDQISDTSDVEKYEIPSIDLVIVDLYPFEQTANSTNDEAEIIEKIDIGGITLIRAAAKNYKHVLVVPSSQYYPKLFEILQEDKGFTDLNQRRFFAANAFHISSHYDTLIFQYFNKQKNIVVFKQSLEKKIIMRYGENPHQKGIFYGKLEEVIDQLHGKELSYNNLVDVDAAINLIREFSENTVIIVKHTNPCGVACRKSFVQAYLDALACDPVSAFGGILIINGIVDLEVATEMNKLFFEILVADGYEKEAFEILKSKKNRILLKQKHFEFPETQFKSILNGVLEQDRDLKTENTSDFSIISDAKPTLKDIEELIFANKIVKHLKSNAIVISKNKQLIGCGMGQTSRIDALKQAILKANTFGFDTRDAVMASDAFFPFADSVEIAFNAGIKTVIQPGGSIRDADSIKFCNEHNMSMVFTGNRHFKH